MIFTDLTVDDRRDIIDYVSDRTGLSRIVVEKDWWVTSVFSDFPVNYPKIRSATNCAGHHAHS